MPFKMHSSEETIGNLRELEIVLAEVTNRRSVSADRDPRADLLLLAQGIWWPESDQARRAISDLTLEKLGTPINPGAIGPEMIQCA